MGFKDLYRFNIAMLGKQVWNILYKPNSLVDRVFKARLYLSDNIFNALRNGAEFYLVGALGGKEEIKKGFRWVMGECLFRPLVEKKA